MSVHPPADDVVGRLRSSLSERYAIERELARGGMATVLLARDTRNRRNVAIKVMHTAFGQAVRPERFLREIEIAARLTHPHILPLHDSGEADGLLYYVMPFVEGESLREKLQREGPLPIMDALRITRDVADALAYAHDRGVVHRDIKPANIMIEAGHAVVADFGVACVLDEGDAERLTSSGIAIGTALYMSPEQATGQHAIDGRTDIYALGCVLYEMLCGDPPFAGRNRQVVLARKLVEPVSSLRVARETVCPAVEHVALKALARSPADRFGTAREFVEALEHAALEQKQALASPQPPHVRPVDERPSPSPDGKVPPLKAAAAGLVLLTLIGFVTNTAYDVKMQIPPEFVPSRWDFPLIGLRALIPGLGIMFLIVIAFVVLKYGSRLVISGLRRTRLRQPIDNVRRQTTHTFTRVLTTADPVMIAEMFFIGGILVSIPVLLGFAGFLPDLWTDRTAGLALSGRTRHNTFTFALAVLVLALVVGWRKLFIIELSRRAAPPRIRLARWGSLGWILVLVIIMTVPWRVLWNNERPRVRLDGERAYILIERVNDLVIYNAERNTTRVYRTSESVPLIRLNTAGYVFESARSFEGDESEH